MSKFLEDIESKIKNIHLAHGLSDDTVTKQISEAVNSAVNPLHDQITELQNQIADLQKAAQDTVEALQNEDTATALVHASAAAGNTEAVASNDNSSGETTGEAATSAQ